jgi:hypothetical protein
MPADKSVPRILQQQPEDESDPQQQSGSGDEQRKPGAQEGNREMGEGSYEATRDYQKDIQDYLKKADVDADAQAAKPRSEQEARDMESAEREGRSHSKGEH